MCQFILSFLIEGANIHLCNGCNIQVKYHHCPLYFVSTHSSGTSGTSTSISAAKSMPIEMALQI